MTITKVITDGMAKRVWHLRLTYHWGPKQIADHLRISPLESRRILYSGAYEKHKAEVLKELKR